MMKCHCESRFLLDKLREDPFIVKGESALSEDSHLFALFNANKLPTAI
jgi:hypothetical protein